LISDFARLAKCACSRVHVGVVAESSASSAPAAFESAPVGGLTCIVKVGSAFLLVPPSPAQLMGGGCFCCCGVQLYDHFADENEKGHMLFKVGLSLALSLGPLSPLSFFLFPEHRLVMRSR
jgi:hypothetical protein